MIRYGLIIEENKTYRHHAHWESDNYSRTVAICLSWLKMTFLARQLVEAYEEVLNLGLNQCKLSRP